MRKYAARSLRKKGQKDKKNQKRAFPWKTNEKAVFQKRANLCQVKCRLKRTTGFSNVGVPLIKAVWVDGGVKS